MNYYKKSFAAYFSVLLFALLFVACESDVDISEDSLEAFGDESEMAIQAQTRSGGGQCFELVYPITITFPDGTSTEIDSFRQIRMEARAWKEANPDISGRVKISFPIEVITADGEVVSIDSFRELKELRKTCADGPFSPHTRPCFRLQMPISVLFPNGDVVEFDTRRKLRHAVRRWKHNNPDATERPSFVFPITIKLKDGTAMTVNSKEELIEIKENCD